MKKVIIPFVAVLFGAVGGAGGSFAMQQLSPANSKPAESAATASRAHGPILPPFNVQAPLVLPDGRLGGYATFTVQLEVASDREEETAAQMPLLLNAINMRTFRTPMARQPDGLIPNLQMFRALVAEAATEAFGKNVVRKVLVTEALPAD